MAATNTYDRSHVLIMPKKFIILRGLQLALGVILFGFGIFGIIFAPFSGIILTFVTAIVTITCAGYTIGSERSPHARAYSYWAILALEIFLVLFWLISFALVATVVGLVAVTYYGGVTYTDTYYDDYYSDVYSGKKMVRRAAELLARGELAKRYSSGADAAIGIFGAAAGLGAAEFVLYVVSLVILSIRIHKHRKAGGHCQPGMVLPTTNLAGAPTGAPMTEAPAVVAYNPNVNQQTAYIGGSYPEGKIELMPQTAVSPVSSPPSQSVTPFPQQQLQQQQAGTYQQQGPGGYSQYQQ